MKTAAAKPGWIGARRLLIALRDIRAEPSTAQQHYGLIVALIARKLLGKAHSIYLRRAGDTLELFATECLCPDSVHNTRWLFAE